jgi:hypothetical protein
MRSAFWKCGQVALCALVASVLILWVSSAGASGREGSRETQDSTQEFLPQQVSPTPTPTPTPTATPSGTPVPQIDGEGTIAGPKGRQAQFFIQDVEKEQVTNKFLEGEFGYSDHKSHVTFTTGNIETCTINGNQGAFTGTARIGGKHKQMVQFTVSVTANQSPATGDTFSISLSNGYTASGNLTSGQITIHTLDPDPGGP